MTENMNADRALKLIAKLSIDRSSQVLSKLIKAGAKITLEKVYIEDISRVTERFISEGEREVVGAFIDLVGDAPFKFLFFVDVKDSLLLCDMMLRREAGTTKELDIYAKSAVQELGNILASAISNVFATDFQISMKPTPPTVINDYSTTIFQEFVMAAALDSNDILIIESMFQVIAQDISCSMYMLPLHGSDRVLQYIVSTM